MSAIDTALSYFVSMGWTPAQAAGIVANLNAESGLRPDAVGDGGTAYGIAQWHPDRQRNFEAVIGKSIAGSTLEEQLAFVHAELNSTEKAAGEALRACVSASDAGACVSKMYERPADREGEAAKRGALAMKIAGEQPAAPVEDHSEQEPAMADGSSSGFDWGNLMKIGVGVATAVNPLIGAVLSAFEPMAQQKLQAMLSKHIDKPEIAAGVASAVMDVVTKATGELNPIKAVAKALDDPSVIAQAQQAALDYLDHVAPMLDKVAEYEKQAWDATEASLAAARAANMASDAADLPWWKSQIIGVTLLLLVPIDFVLWQVMTDPVTTPEIKSMAVGIVLGQGLSGIIGYFYGTTKQSAAKDATIKAIATAKGQ